MERQEFTIGTEARCSDESCGYVLSVVVDPHHRVTHLVVEPKHQQGRGRLVPWTSSTPGPTTFGSVAPRRSSKSSKRPKRLTFHPNRAVTACPSLSSTTQFQRAMWPCMEVTTFMPLMATSVRCKDWSSTPHHIK